MRYPSPAVDLAIVGAGPAGLAAATRARAHGASVLLLDEGPAPGGRIWQAIERRAPVTREAALGRAAVEDLRASGTEMRFGASVWSIEGRRLCWSEGGAARSAEAAAVLLATGTTERPLPLPGWTLPGVMTVGAAQILLKSAGLVPQGQTWIAGQGPLVLLYAVQALAAGGRIAGILDLSDPARRREAAARLPAALASPAALGRGLAWRRRIARAGVPWICASDVAAWGDGRVEHLRFRAKGEVRFVDADTLLLHDGVIPAVQASRAAGCAHVWDRAQQCWRPQVDEWGRTSRPGLWVAGDAAGVGGWQAAYLSGLLAALDVLAGLGLITPALRDARARPLRLRRARRLALRPFLDALYPPLHTRLDDEVIVCRCEEVSAGDLRAAAALGCLGLNQIKAFSRCGMGPCQGRMCLPTAARLLAEARGVSADRIEPVRPRAPIRPVTLGELAALDD